MHLLHSVSSDLEYWSVNHTSIYENSELKIFKNITFGGEILNNWPNDSLGTNWYKTLESCWSLYKTLECINTTSVIYKWDTFSSFSYLLIFVSKFIVSGVQSSR